MPSTYSPDLRIELIANGEQSGTWGSTTNSNLGTIIEDAIAGLATVTISSSNQALTALNGAADQARCAAVALTGASAPFNLFVPPVTKLYVIKNNTAYSASVYCSTVIGNTTAAGAGMDVHAGKSALIRSDGTNVTDQLNYVSDSFEVGGPAVFNSTVTLNADPTLALQAATKQYVDSVGSASFPVGGIIMWSGTIATIPSGWALCDGTGGTPDLRNQFIIGAHSDDAGVAKTTITGSATQTGGSKDAIVVSHTHTGTTDTAGNHTHTTNAQYWNSPVSGAPDAYYPGFRGAAATINAAGNHTHTFTTAASGSSGTNANLVPYYALAFIMKT